MQRDKVLTSDVTPVRHQAPRDDVQLAPGTILGRRYRIVSRLGAGGMGEVYRADDLQIGHPVALKFLRGSEPLHGSFAEEVRLGRRIVHPNVCSLYDVAEIGGRFFLIMELVDGEDLGSLLRRIGRLPPEKAVSIARDLCAGLAAIHATGIVHRDLKPANVMIDGRGRARITDLGLAIDAGNDGASSAGTPAYMAPEQLAGDPATFRTDVYALGLILYEVFTGFRVTREAIVRPSDLVPEISARTERIILRCLDANPAARPATVDAIAAELPEFDPLATAIAAGDTPTPQMVAASLTRGDLPRRSAILVLSLAAAAGIASAVLTSRSVPSLEAPQVLAARAREILALAGADGEVADTASNLMRGEEELLDLLPHLTAPARAKVTYIYRTSPAPMRTRGIVSARNPPLTSPGMTMVRLDGDGNLLDLVVVPPLVRPRGIARAADWEALVRRTGLQGLEPIEPRWSAPVDNDGKRAWRLRGRGTIVEGAAWQGRVVWLSVIEPWQHPSSSRPTPERYLTPLALLMMSVLPVGAAWLALRNVRRGAGDRAGAFRVAVSYAIGFAIALTASSYHDGTAVGEWNTMTYVAAFAAYGALTAWVFYLAIEPFARRRWPHLLVSWQRVLSGRWRDAMVGRDVLIGCSAGAVMALIAKLAALALPAASRPLLASALPLGSGRYAIFWLVWPLPLAILRGVAMVALLLLFRRFAPALLTLVTALLVLDYFAAPLPVALGAAVAASTVLVAILLRFGLVAAVTASYVTDVLFHVPLSLALGSWYFDQSLFAVAVLATLAGTAFKLATQRRAV